MGKCNWTKRKKTGCLDIVISFNLSIKFLFACLLFIFSLKSLIEVQKNLLSLVACVSTLLSSTPSWPLFMQACPCLLSQIQSGFVFGLLKWIIFIMASKKLQTINAIFVIIITIIWENWVSEISFMLRIPLSVKDKNHNSTPHRSCPRPS